MFLFARAYMTAITFVLVFLAGQFAYAGHAWPAATLAVFAIVIQVICLGSIELQLHSLQARLKHRREVAVFAASGLDNIARDLPRIVDVVWAKRLLEIAHQLMEAR